LKRERYTVVFEGEKLGLGMQAGEGPGDLPVITTTPPGKDRPAIGHILVAVDGKAVEGGGDAAFHHAVELIKHSSRPVSITFLVGPERVAHEQEATTTGLFGSLMRIGASTAPPSIATSGTGTSSAAVGTSADNEEAVSSGLFGFARRTTSFVAASTPTASPNIMAGMFTQDPSAVIDEGDESIDASSEPVLKKETSSGLVAVSPSVTTGTATSAAVGASTDNEEAVSSGLFGFARRTTSFVAASSPMTSPNIMAGIFTQDPSAVIDEGDESVEAPSEPAPKKETPSGFFGFGF